MLFVKIKLEILNQNRQVNFSVDRCIFLNRPSCLPKMEENYFVNIDTGFINSFIHNLSLLPRTVIFFMFHGYCTTSNLLLVFQAINHNTVLNSKFMC